MSMAYLPEDEDEKQARSWLRYGAPVLILLVLGLAVLWFSRQQTAVERQANIVSTLMPVTLPPPPPPPPKPIEQPKPVEQQVVQPTNTPPPPTPAPTPSVNNAVTENAPAQEGSDAFNIGAGSGNGMTGSGGGGIAMNAAQYGQYARGAILAAVRKDDVLKGKDFVANVRVWFDAQGAVSRVTIAKTTGTQSYDSELTKILSVLSGFPAPPQTVIAQMPIQFTIDERRS
jgi:periplasmic protein TonB